jgi:hypothetical protein
VIALDVVLVGPDPEMEYLDIYWRILKKTILLLFFSAFNNPYKKIPETRKLESFHETHFIERKNKSIKPDENSSPRRLEFMPAQQPRLKMAFKNSIPGLQGAAGRRRLQLSRQELGVVLTPASQHTRTLFKAN